MVACFQRTNEGEAKQQKNGMRRIERNALNSASHRAENAPLGVIRSVATRVYSHGKGKGKGEKRAGCIRLTLLTIFSCFFLFYLKLSVRTAMSYIHVDRLRRYHTFR